MEPLKRLIGGLSVVLVVLAAILAVPVVGHLAIAMPTLAASPIDGGPRGASTGTRDGLVINPAGGPSTRTPDCTLDPTSDCNWFPPTPTGTLDPTPTRTLDPTPTGTLDPTPTRTLDPTPTGTPDPTPTRTPDPTPTRTPDPTPTSTPDRTAPGSPPTTAPGSPPGGRPSTGKGVPIALVGGTGGGLSLTVLLVLWAFTSHARKVRRHVRWVKEHLRAAAGSSLDLPSAEIRPRPGARSVSLGLEPHDDHLGNQKIKED